MTIPFAPRSSVPEVEEGQALAPRCPAEGPMACVTPDGTVPMPGWMEAQARRPTVAAGAAHGLGRAGQAVGRWGATSGLAPAVVPLRSDDDQEARWLSVGVAGKDASCHAGDRSCLDREVPFGAEAGQPLRLTGTERRLDALVHGDAPERRIM